MFISSLLFLFSVPMSKICSQRCSECVRLGVRLRVGYDEVTASVCSISHVELFCPSKRVARVLESCPSRRAFREFHSKWSFKWSKFSENTSAMFLEFVELRGLLITVRFYMFLLRTHRMFTYFHVQVFQVSAFSRSFHGFCRNNCGNPR